MTDNLNTQTDVANTDPQVDTRTVVNSDGSNLEARPVVESAVVVNDAVAGEGLVIGLDEFEVHGDRNPEIDGSSPPSLEDGVRTYFVFLDLPRHIEFRAGNLPLMPEGIVVEFDIMIRGARNPTKRRALKGSYQLQRRVLKYSSNDVTRSGLTQYLEWRRCEA